jgi:GTP-binding protein HflX
VKATRSDPAVVVKRVDAGTADVSEITELAAAANYQVRDVLTQTRTESPEFHIGEGKVEELAAAVRNTNANTVIFDNRLGPYQTYNLGTKLPDGIEVIDRFTLILKIFGQRAETRKAQLQVELAELRYELPRAEAKVSLARRDEHPGFMGLGEYDESYEQDLKARISRIKDELEQIEKTENQRRDHQRKAGFDLVALAGYTNAGKSTLLQRLAAELEVGQNDELHPDLKKTAASENQLFTTLGTTTRRMDLDRREILVTDTVGFISELPHWLVESFKSTLDSVYQADLVLLVVDVTDSVETMREKLMTAHDTLYERNEAPIVTVLNKIDAISESELREKTVALDALAPNPIAVSAKTGENIPELESRIDAALPELEHERRVSEYIRRLPFLWIDVDVDDLVAAHHLKPRPPSFVRGDCWQRARFGD